MNLYHLKYFTACYQQRSFSDAAKLIHITPQGLSKAIHKLEKELDVPLLLSQSDGSLHPTKFADRLYEYALCAVSERTKLEKNFQIIKAKELNLLRVGISFGLLDTVGLSFFSQFEFMNPNIKLVYSEEPDVRCEEHLLHGQYDIALTRAPFDTSFETEKLGASPFIQWVNKDNPLSKSSVIKAEDLQKHALATPGRGFKSYDALMNLCHQKKIKPKHIEPVSDMSWIYHFVLDNKGIGSNVGLILNVSNLSGNNGRVNSVPFEDMSFDYGVSWRKGSVLNELQRLFICQVLDYHHA